jgi:hypothetical protein
VLKAGRWFWVFVTLCSAVIGAMLLHSFITYQTVSRVEAPASVRAMPMDTLTRVSAGFVEATGAPPPAPVDRPRFVQADEASEYIAPEDEVYLVEAPEGALVFPRALMQDYEVVNFAIGGRRATLTYCANTESVVAFWGDFAGVTTTFESTKLFVNRNLVLRDRASGSLWPQLLGVATQGHLQGLRLGHVPVYPTEWGRIIKAYPEASVLAMDSTRRVISRVRVARGSVLPTPMYVPRVFDDRLPGKSAIVGVWLEDASAAIPVEAVKVRHCVPFQAGDARLVAISDAKLGVVRLFDRRLGGSALVLDPVGGVVVDRATRSVWDDRGRCVSGALRGLALKPVDPVFCTWDAWAAFFPETEVYR